MELLICQGLLTATSAFLIVRLLLLDRPYQIAQYYLKKTLFLTVFLSSTFLFIPYFCLCPCSVSNGRCIWSSMKLVGNLTGVKWEVRGTQHELLVHDKPCIIVANHQSTLDLVGKAIIFDYVRFFLIAKRELLYLGVVGLSGWLCGMVFIDRKNPTKANATITRASKIMIKEKTKMWFYPEGLRNKNNRNLLPFKKGAFRVGVTCQVPILPIVFSPHYFLDEDKHVFEPGKVIATFLPPISTDGLTENNVEELTETTRNLMSKTYEKLYKEILSDKSLTIGYNKLEGK